MTPGIGKAFLFLGDDIVELSTEKESMKKRIKSCNKRWLEESKANVFKKFMDEKRANVIMS